MKHEKIVELHKKIGQLEIAYSVKICEMINSGKIEFPGLTITDDTEEGHIIIGEIAQLLTKFKTELGEIRMEIIELDD